MVFLFAEKCRFIPASGLILAHLTAVFFAPWFHQHAGENHATVNGDFYHSHLSPFAAYESEHGKDDHAQSAETGFLDVRSLPLETMGGILVVDDGRISNPAKSEVHLDIVATPDDCLSIAPLFVENLSRVPSFPSPQEYCALTATNLSPPQA